MKISEVSLPAESALRHALQRIDYCDSYETQLIKSDLSVNEAYLAIEVARRICTVWLSG